ncbi:MAG: Tm-1-like ATP-binding domain-containing protein, partial [Succiniclasticum sp.]
RPVKGLAGCVDHGNALEGPEERAKLFETLKKDINNPHVKITEMDNNINDKDFALTAAQKLIDLMKK